MLSGPLAVLWYQAIVQQIHFSEDVETLGDLHRITSLVGDAALRDQLKMQGGFRWDGESLQYSRQTIANKRRKLENKKRESL